jgi:L-asparaginase II
MSVIEVTRGPRVESRHAVHVAVAHATSGIVASSGDAGHVSFVRSAIKMFQALPLVEDGVADALPITLEELALCTASHNGEPFHVNTARSLLAKAGVDEMALACGPHEPMYPPAAEALKAAGASPGRIHNNCSGKHAGMLALVRHHGWPIEGYHAMQHPLQQRVLQTFATWSGVGVDAIDIATDGCGLPTFAVPLDRVAIACARFAAAAAGNAHAAVVVRAMTSHPQFVAGTGRLCTVLMERARGCLFAKVGAEGYYCAGIPGRQLGIALKVDDGARRASEPALLAVLRALDVLTEDDLEQMRDFAHPAILNTRGEVVGEIRARVNLQPGRTDGPGAEAG